MGKMWEMMQMHHQRQAEISKVLKSLDISQAVKETNDHHHERTIQLLAVVQEWHTQFCRMIDNQKMYIKSLGGWLKLNLIPIESTLKEKVSSPPRVPNPAIQKLLHIWYDRLDKIPDEMARTAIGIEALTVRPARSPRYTVEAPKRRPNSAPRMTARTVNSAGDIDAATYGLKVPVSVASGVRVGTWAIGA